MANDLSLLFKLRADNAQAKTTLADTRQAVNQLRQSFGPQLTQAVTVANKSFADLGPTLNSLVSRHVPLVGGAIVRVTDHLRGLASEGSKTEKTIGIMAKSIELLSNQSGRSVPVITTFLKQFVQIEGQAQANSAAVDFFGASLAGKLAPELRGITSALGELTAEGGAAAAGLGLLAGAAAAAVAVVAIEVAGIVVLSKQLFELAKQTAEYEGRLVDLSQQTGVTVETLNALDITLTKVGGSLDSAVQSLIAFQRNLADGQDQSSKAGKAFSQLGVNIRDTETTLRDTLKALAAMPEGFRQTDLAAQLFGSRGGKQILAALKETHGDIDKVITDLGGLARVTTEQARRADEFNDKLGDLHRLLRGLTSLIGREVIPIALGALGDLEGLIKDNQVAFEALAVAVKAAAALLSVPFRGAILALNLALASQKPELELIVELYERLAAAVQGIRGKVPEVDPNAIPKQPTAPLESSLDNVTLEDLGAGPFRTKEQLDKLKAALADQLDALRDAIGDRNQVFQAESEDQRRELEKRLLDFKKYIESARASNETRLKATLADLATERAAIKSALAQRAIDANDAAKKIREIDNQERDARRAATKERQRLDDEVAAHERKQLEATTEVLRATIDAQLRIANIGDEQRIASIRELAAARVQSEEDAEREILKIRLAAIDREKQRLETEVSATASIQDPEEQLKVRAQLNLQLRILAAERTAIEQDGERDIQAGRERDLRNEQHYADELEDIRAHVRDVERAAGQEVIRLMALHFESRAKIIREQAKQDIEDEQARHRNAQQGIAALRQENLESNRTAQEKIDQEAEIHRLEEAESERHRLALAGIKKQAQQDEKRVSPLSRLSLGIEDLKEFADVIDKSIVPLGQILTDTFSQVADAIGQVAANWVLLGETGPAVMRKILAQALASITAEAAVNAIKESALGFATLFFNPAESAAHFTAAGLWASIGGVSALVGRNLAGGLFKPQSSARSGGGSGSGAGQINTATLARNAGTEPQRQIIELHIQSNDSHIVKVVRNNYRDGGDIREVIIKDGGVQ